jgi:hypothetical protein
MSKELTERERGYNEGVHWAADWLLSQADSNDAEIKTFSSNIADSIRSHKKPWGDAQSPFACRVCGVECEAHKDGIQPYCPEHCEDHLYEYNPDTRNHTCINCFQPAPHDHFDED